jgi:hypothetical protein
VLHVHLATCEEPQTSLCRALASLAGPGDYVRLDWTSIAPQDRQARILQAFEQLRPSLVFMQLQRPGVLDVATVAALRSRAPRSELTIVHWCGDVGPENGPYHSSAASWGYELAQYCDLMLYSSLSQVRAHRSRGMLRAAYLQIGFDEDRYYPASLHQGDFRHEVVFLGTHYDDRHWSSMPGHAASLRHEVAIAFRTQLGPRFGLFGAGWGAPSFHVAPAESGHVYRHARFAVSVSLFNDLERYTSDRLLRALACGRPVLMKAFSDHASFGVVHGQNALVFDTTSEALKLYHRWREANDEPEIAEIGRRGAALARDHHSWGVRMLELAPLVAAARGREPQVSRPW